jgi:hypothetical protein
LNPKDGLNSYFRMVLISGEDVSTDPL